MEYEILDWIEPILKTYQQMTLKRVYFLSNIFIGLGIILLLACFLMKEKQ